MGIKANRICTPRRMHQAQHGVKAIDDVERFVAVATKNEAEPEHAPRPLQ
jgi:hypothetical protein